jgi:sugar lactone lactonase YvrE
MFSAKDRNVKVSNTPADPQCVFSDVTRNPKIRGGLNGVAVDANGIIYTGNYGDGRVWKLTPGADGRIVKSEEILHAGGLSVTPDGMCVDCKGNLYIADMRGDALQRILPCGKVEFLRKGGFTSPSEPCVWKGSVYVANYRGTTLEVVPLCEGCCKR